jgi:hypothetical protein
MGGDVITRRTAVKHISALAAVAMPAWCAASANETPRVTGMGLVIYDCKLRRNGLREKDNSFDLFSPLTFLQHCQSLGAGGMQAALGVLQTHEIRELQAFAQQHDMFIDAIIKPPQNQDDVARFAAEIETARNVGVQAARTTIYRLRMYNTATHGATAGFCPERAV